MNSATNKTYTALLARIQTGQIQAGDFLIESDLAQDLGVSRTPVREAIRRLAAEGLVLTEGRRRAIVRQFDAAETDELFELRARLESFAAERAATRIDAAQLARLRELDAEMRLCTGTTDPLAVARFADLNDEFHQVILEAARAVHLEAALRPVLQIQLILLQRFRLTIARTPRTQRLAPPRTDPRVRTARSAARRRADESPHALGARRRVRPRRRHLVNKDVP
jgi:DNA-binding GntR family transcriptional regulator